jgi:hypothetical protein
MRRADKASVRFIAVRKGMRSECCRSGLIAPVTFLSAGKYSATRRAKSFWLAKMSPLNFARQGGKRTKATAIRGFSFVRTHNGHAWGSIAPTLDQLAVLVAQLDAEQRALCLTLTFSFAGTSCVRVVRIQRQMGRSEEVADLLEQCEDNVHGGSRLI